MVIALPHHPPPPPHPPHSHSRSSSPAGFKMVKGLSEGAGSGSSSHASSAQQRPPRSLWRIETSVNAANSFHGSGGGKAAGDGSGGGPMATASSSSAAQHTATTSSAARPLTPPPSDSSLDRMTYSTSNASSSAYDPAAGPPPQRSSSGKSKNDIFERGSPLLTPPKPPPPILARRGGSGVASLDAMTPPSSAPASTTSTPASASAPKSRNSLFFDTPSSSPSFAVWRGGWQPNVDASRQTSSPQAQAPPPLPTPPPVPSSSASPWDESKPLYTTTHLSRDTQRPSLGRLSSDEQQRERERIRGASGDVDFRLCPSKQYLLGEGRHCNVYLGSYRKRRGSASRQEEWQLCAIKRLHADRQSQLLGLDEGFALRRIGPHPGIVELIDIRDEVMATTPASASTATSQAQLGMGRPASNSVSLHGRSTSAAHGGAPGRSQQHMRLASQPAVRIEGDDYDYSQADEDDEIPSSASALAAQQSSTTSTATPHSPPRLLILLSLHPHSLATYSRRHSPSITLDFWLRTALDLSSTLSYLHSRGCVHADVKPENILLDGSGRTKLCDFNSAFFPGKASMPLTDGLGLGTPAYGAPELTKRTGGTAVVSYPIDVFSLGAVLYGLATGVEPMSRARSAVDMLHRKEHFFAMEENERLNRVAISQGWGNGGGSGTASRTSSMRSKRSKATGAASTTASNNGSPPSRRSSLRTRRDSNESSLDGSASIASNVTTMGGQKPSVAAVQALLEPGEAAGVLPALLERSASGASSSSAGGRIQAVGASGHQRASSLNKARQDLLRGGNNGASNTASGLGSEEGANSPHRPTWLRRTTSYGGPDGGAPGSNGMTPSPSHDSRLLSPPLSPNQSLLPAATLTGAGRSGDGELSLAVAASFADASARGSAAPSTSQSLQQRLLKQQSGASQGHARTPSVESTASYTSSASTTSSSMAHSSPITSTSADQLVSPSPYDSAEEDEEQIDTRPYLDGSPALLLPGGGRLPQAALDLVEEMLRVDPRRRPGMGEVGRRLEMIAGEVGWEQ